MAVLPEDVKWRTSARGKRYANCAVSDATGQFIASCFDEDAAKQVEEAAKSGVCLLISVELDRQSGEETPRVTIRRAQRMEGLAANTRLKAQVDVTDSSAMPVLAALVAGERGGRGEIHVTLALPQGGHAQMCLGRNFALDTEIASQMEVVQGVTSVVVEPIDPHRLALVS
jgi:DNA polymerase-3 subunit alpha